MTTTATRRIGVVLAVSSLLAGGHAARAEESSAIHRSGLTMGGEPLARFLHADSTLLDSRTAQARSHLVATAHSAARADRRDDRKKRIGRGAAVGAGFGTAMGFFSGYSWCDNEAAGTAPATH